ncbi:MAG: response regulator transcription factor [Opitutae bacterium]|nr:response regulator transcription factor [Opitutae bacterium]
MRPSTKILVVDDEPAVRLVLTRFLGAAGFAVVECKDGVEAIEQVPREKPALIVLDVEMPRMDGWKTLKELRQRGCRAPVLMLTNVDNIPARVRGLEAGADDYLSKPCDLIELLARIKALVRRSQMSLHAPRRLRFGDLVVELDRKVATRGKEVVSLTRTEYAVLDLLAEHHGKPVSREMMLGVVWRSAESPNFHTVETCLWRLRKKLGERAGESRWLRNLPGIGHVLECEIEPPAGPE